MTLARFCRLKIHPKRLGLRLGFTFSIKLGRYRYHVGTKLLLENPRTDMGPSKALTVLASHIPPRLKIHLAKGVNNMCVLFSIQVAATKCKIVAGIVC